MPHKWSPTVFLSRVSDREMNVSEIEVKFGLVEFVLFGCGGDGRLGDLSKLRFSSTGGSPLLDFCPPV